jgi:hypothetical protein
MNVKHFSLLVRLGMLSLFFPFSGHLYSQQITISGNIEFFVAGNQGLQVPDGFVVKDNAKNILPPTLILSDGAVLLDAATALYKVHSVPASGSAVFYAAFPLNARTATDRNAVSIVSPSVLSGAKAGLTVVNGASGVSDFTLKLDAATGLGTSSLPVVWEVSQTAGSGIGDLIFSWDASLETSTLANKRLYRYVSGAWTVLPAANTTAGTNSLTYSGYTDVLSSTRFGIASGLTVTPTPTDPLCTGGAGSLTVSASGGLGTRSYKLNNGTWQSSGQFNNLTAGTYTVYVKDDAGDEVSEMVTITDPPPVTANVTGDLTICAGETTTLTATGGTSYLWNGTLGTNAAIMVSPTTNTTYSVSVTDANNCLSTASVTVQIYAVQPPVITFTDNTGLNSNDGTICAGSNAMVNITGAVSYSWSDGSTASSRTLTPACTTPYSLTVTDANGCTTTSNLQISVSFEPSVTQITPTTGSVGTTITINGKNLDNVSAVKINGQSASGLVIVSSTQLKVNLPSGGPVTELQMVSPCGTTTVPVSTPTITSFTPGAGNPGTIITITGTNLDQLVSASAGGKSAIILSRTATKARILVMPGAATGVVSVTSATATASTASSFTVNTTPFPYFQQGARITNSSTNAVQGSCVSVSADGNTAIIGAPGDDSNKGAAWIYVRNGTAWSQQAKLVGTGAVGAARQGTGVAISANGNTAVVGGTADNSNAGAIWVFTRNGTTWSQQGNKLTGSGALGAAQQGISVAVSGDGNTIASGGFADDNYIGAAWAFARYGNNWAQVGDKITGNDFNGAARQGSSLSLNGDGTRLMMGGYQDNNRQGAVWIFGTDGCEWTQLGPKLVGTGGTSQAWQGFSVSLSADGNTAVTGGNSDSNLAGAAWVYTYSGSAWAQQARLVGAQAAGAARQGSSVTLSADGNTLMVGGNGDDSNKGAVWVYRKTGANWTQQGAKIKGSNAAGPAKQGSSVSVSANGTTAVIGGPNDNTNKGAFWVYIPATSIPSMQQVLLEERAATTAALRLDQNTPNPFTGSTTITFSVPEACMAEWEITDVSGRVIHLLRRAYSGGENTEIFDLSGNSGVFYYRLKTPFGTESRKMLIVR